MFSAEYGVGAARASEAGKGAGRLSGVSLATLMFAACIGGVANAQDDAADTADEVRALETVTVTAQRREENLQRTPVAVSAFSSETLVERQIDNVGSLQNAVPGLTIVPGRGSTNNAQVSLRGVGQMSQTLQFDPGVGIYVDDVYLARSQSSLLDLYGVSRVEVLRGPQGTLYGRNTIGGAIKIISERPDPSDSFGEVKLRTGSYGLLDAGASANIALAEDRAAIRVSGLRKWRRGYQENFDDTYASGQNLIAGRISAFLAPYEDLDVLINVDATDDRAPVAHGRQMNVLDYGGLGIFGPTPDAYKTTSRVPNDNYYRNYGVSSNVSWSGLDALTLTSITAYRRNWFQANIDLDGTPEDIFSSIQKQRQWQFSQELQASFELGNLDVVSGLFYFREQTDSNLSTHLVVALAPDFNLTIPGESNSDITTHSYAAFAHGVYALSPEWSVSAGLRWSRDKKSTSLVPDQERSFNSLVPKLSVDYHPTDDLLVYASYTQGFKAGSFNVFATDTIVPFEPETVDSYEIGLKSDLLQNRLRLNLAAFHAGYENFQADTIVPGPDGTPTRFTLNAASATTKGIEFEAFARPTTNLSLTGTYTYLNAEFDDYRNSPFGDLSGTPLANAPKHTVGLSASYDVSLSPDFDLTLQADATHRSKSFRYPGTHDRMIEDPNTIVNAQLLLSPASDRWTFSAGVKNLTDEVVLADGYDVRSLGMNNLLLLFYKEPRTWTAGLTYRF